MSPFLSDIALLGSFGRRGRSVALSAAALVGLPLPGSEAAWQVACGPDMGRVVKFT